MQERGVHLENYLNKSLENILSRKGFFYAISKIKKFQIAKNKFEEIDLIINLKSVVLVAEVKCIRYPFEPRNKHNSLRILKKASEQVIRKIEFIKTNSSIIESHVGSIHDKEIIPLVITNFPIYTGYLINDVPIVDFFLVESFFQAGVMTNYKLAPKTKSEVIKEHKYYKNEIEMNNVLKDFFKRPFPLKEFEELIELKEHKISLEPMDFDLYVLSAQMKD